jgi:hypothetical protein
MSAPAPWFYAAHSAVGGILVSIMAVGVENARIAANNVRPTA